jgi:hypothetical protein
MLYHMVLIHFSYILYKCSKDNLKNIHRRTDENPLFYPILNQKNLFHRLILKTYINLLKPSFRYSKLPFLFRVSTKILCAFIISLRCATCLNILNLFDFIILIFLVKIIIIILLSLKISLVSSF